MARPKKYDGVVYQRPDSKVWWMRFRDRDGRRRLESTHTEDWQEAQRALRERLQARDDNTLEIVRKGEALSFGDWADFFLENYSKPPIRAVKTHAANKSAVKTLRRAFGALPLIEVTPLRIEAHLRTRLDDRKTVRRKEGIAKLPKPVKPTTVHQEFRVLRRIFSVAVKKKLCRVNPCSAVEFPVSVKGLFRPHYMSWSEQRLIEANAPAYLRNVIRIITETGLRVYKELAPMRKDQIDLVNRVVFIPDSKTPTGVAEVPLTAVAAEAFENQINLAGPGPWLFPSDRKADSHQSYFKKAWELTLRRAKVPYFRLYDLRSTFATRLSAGGVADEWVTQLLRQTDAQVFKKYSQMKLGMKREALTKLNREANESEAKPAFDTDDKE